MKLFFLKLKDRYGGNYLFLFVVLIIYTIVWLIDYTYFIRVFHEVVTILVDQILLVLCIVFVMMFILNLVLQKEVIQKKITKAKSSTKYIISILGGIFSTGPVYMRYPFLKKLKDHGLHYGHIVTFIYARSVKIPFLAIMIFYFWLTYTIIFNITLIGLSLLLWIILHFIFNHIYHEY